MAQTAIICHLYANCFLSFFTFFTFPRFHLLKAISVLVSLRVKTSLPLLARDFIDQMESRHKRRGD